MYTFVVGSFCVVAFVGFFLAWFAPVRRKPLSESEALKPVMALGRDRARTGRIVSTSEGQNQTDIIMADGSVWFVTLIEHGFNSLALIYAQSPDFRRTPKDTYLIVEDGFAVSALRKAWAETATWQEGDYVSA